MTIMLSALLYENGLPNLPVLLVEPHRNHAGVWRIKFNYDNNEPLSMDAAQATKLAVCLCQMGEVDFGAEIDSAVESATRYSSMSTFGKSQIKPQGGSHG
jgi:hypothetical protein